MSACVGECGDSVATQVLITTTNPTTGCAGPPCSLRLTIDAESNLCPSRSVKIKIQTANALIWDATYTVNGDATTPNPIAAGHVELLTGGAVSAGEVVTITASKFDNGGGIVCKTEGNLVFDVTLLH